MRNVTIVDVAQRSPEWFSARLGRVTSSRADDVCATLKSGGEAAGRRNYRVQLVLERLTGRNQERTFQTAAMTQGVEREPDAVAIYEALTGRFLQTSGFLQHDELMAGASLDGHLDDFTGIVEIKSPLPATHLSYLRSGQIPSDYQRQIVHQLWMTGAQWCDWLSYCPEFPEPLQVKLVRVVRDQAAVDGYELLLRQFIRECEQEYAEVARMAMVAA